MTITVVLRDEAAQIAERQVSEGHYPDVESAVTAALTLLEDVAVDWSDVDTAAIGRLIAEADAEGGELTRDDVTQSLELSIQAAQRRG